MFFYEQDFYVLSNFSAFNVQWNGLRFQTLEAAYHYQKFPGNDNYDVRELIMRATSAHNAMAIAKQHIHARTDDWQDIKVTVMKTLMRAKLDQHEYVRQKLLATGNRELVEDSWRDDFWGWGPNKDGQNMMGKLWMEIRDEIRVGDTRVQPKSEEGKAL